MRRYDLSGGKGSPASSFRAKEDLLLPAVPSATSGTPCEDVSSMSSARSDLVPAPAPLWLTMERGPVPAPCRAQAGVVDDIIRGHMDNGEDPALGEAVLPQVSVIKLLEIMIKAASASSMNRRSLPVLEHGPAIRGAGHCADPISLPVRRPGAEPGVHSVQGRSGCCHAHGQGETTQEFCDAQGRKQLHVKHSTQHHLCMSGPERMHRSASLSAVASSPQDRYYVSGGIGGCVKQIGQDVPWLSAMCGYTLTPQHHEVLVIEDMLEDARCDLSVPPAGFLPDMMPSQG